MDLLTLHFARHALAEQAAGNPALAPALSAVDEEIRQRLLDAPPGSVDHGAMAAALAGVGRSSHWPKVRQEHLEKEPKCVITGSDQLLEVHHTETFERAIVCGRPDLELDQRFLVTVTRAPGNDLHLMLHLDDFQSIDLNYVADIPAWRGKSEAEVRADPAFKAAVLARPCAAHQMTPEQKAAERARLDRLFPVDTSPTGPCARWGIVVKPA